MLSFRELNRYIGGNKNDHLIKRHDVNFIVLDV